MKIYVVLHPQTRAFMSVHRYITDVAAQYALNVNTVRSQFSRKGLYSNEGIIVECHVMLRKA